MFGKLLKYEFKSTAKWYLLITLIALGLSVITGVIGGSATNGFVDMETNSMQIITGTLGILIFGGVIGLYLSNYYIIIRRFYSNLYGREGYLTWTLPASPHAIILSKFVGALVASLYCLFLLFFSGFITILVMGAVIGQDLSPVFSVLSLRLLVILLLIGLSSGGFLPQLQESYYFMYQSHLANCSKIVVD